MSKWYLDLHFQKHEIGHCCIQSWRQTSPGRWPSRRAWYSTNMETTPFFSSPTQLQLLWIITEKSRFVSVGVTWQTGIIHLGQDTNHTINVWCFILIIQKSTNSLTFIPTRIVKKKVDSEFKKSYFWKNIE